MDKSHRAIAKRLADLESEFRALLKDAPWKQNNEPKSYQRDAKDNHPEIHPSTTIFPNRNPPAPKQHNANSKWRKPVEWWKPRLEIAGIVFAIGYAVVTGLQWYDLRQNFAIEQRSWIKVGLTFSEDDIRKSEITAQIINFGKSSAKIYGEGVVEIVDSRNPPSFDYRQVHSTTNRAPVFPGESSAFTIALYDSKSQAPRRLTDTETANLLSGAAYVAIYGIVVYADHFDTHWTRFCGWKNFSPGSTFMARSCVSYNSAGDGNPKKKEGELH